MRKIITFSFLALTVSFAATAQSGARGIIHGMVTAEKANQPIDSVQAFVYAADSGIVGSGYTDATGNYETNQIPAGTYNVKFVYPSKKAYMVTGVPIKGGGTVLNIKQAMPLEDGTIGYSDLRHKK